MNDTNSGRGANDTPLCLAIAQYAPEMGHSELRIVLALIVISKGQAEFSATNDDISAVGKISHGAVGKWVNSKHVALFFVRGAKRSTWQTVQRMDSFSPNNGPNSYPQAVDNYANSPFFGLNGAKSPNNGLNEAHAESPNSPFFGLNGAKSPNNGLNEAHAESPNSPFFGLNGAKSPNNGLNEVHGESPNSPFFGLNEAHGESPNSPFFGLNAQKVQIMDCFSPNNGLFEGATSHTGAGARVSSSSSSSFNSYIENKKKEKEEEEERPAAEKSAPRRSKSAQPELAQSQSDQPKSAKPKATQPKPAKPKSAKQVALEAWLDAHAPSAEQRRGWMLLCSAGVAAQSKVMGEILSHEPPLDIVKAHVKLHHDCPEQYPVEHLITALRHGPSPVPAMVGGVGDAEIQMGSKQEPEKSLLSPKHQQELTLLESLGAIGG